MELSRIDLNIERGNGEKYGEVERSPDIPARIAKQSQNTSASSTRNRTSTSQVLHRDISSRTQSESVGSNTANRYQTSDDFSIPNSASHIDIELLGLAPRAHQGYQLGDAHQEFLVKQIGTKPPSECLYHLPILQMSDNVNGCEKNLDPMARWLSEDHTEQCTVLHLPNGQLSIHKECRCSDMLQAGMEVEIEE